MNPSPFAPAVSVDVCWCRRCESTRIAAARKAGASFWESSPRFIVCPDCGNKRCPKAAYHGHPCGNSNEPNQPGSDYQDAAVQHLREDLAGAVDLEGGDPTELLIMGAKMIAALQYWRPKTVVACVTHDPSLVLRANAEEHGWLHLSLIVGTDRDPAEDTFFSLRKDGQEVVGFSGPFADVLAAIKSLTHLQPT